MLHEKQPLTHGPAQMVGKFKRRRARSALPAIDDDIVRQDIRLEHGLDDAHELPGLSDTKFETDGLAARQFSQFANELHEFDRGGKGAVPCWRDAVAAARDAARLGDRKSKRLNSSH